MTKELKPLKSILFVSRNKDNKHLPDFKERRYVRLTTKTPEELKTLVEETYKGYNGIKGVRQTIEIQDGKVVQDAEFDFTVANIDELRKAFPEEYSGVGKTISFAASKKLLTELGFTEKTD